MVVATRESELDPKDTEGLYHFETEKAALEFVVNMFKRIEEAGETYTGFFYGEVPPSQVKELEACQDASAINVALDRLNVPREGWIEVRAIWTEEHKSEHDGEIEISHRLRARDW
jgi:hypothetical protein